MSDKWIFGDESQMEVKTAYKALLISEDLKKSICFNNSKWIKHEKLSDWPLDLHHHSPISGDSQKKSAIFG